MKVAVFDSGAGGLLVLARLRRVRPRADYDYISDPKHLPYGSRSAGEVTELVRRALATASADVVVLACNTATALAAPALRAELACPVYGIEPAVGPARARATGPITVLCTPATARVKAAQWRDLAVVAMPDLAERIEEDRTPAALASLADEVARALTRDVVLGCTHYSYLAPALRERGFVVYDGADGLARHAARGIADEGTGALRFHGRDYGAVLGEIDIGRPLALY